MIDAEIWIMLFAFLGFLLILKGIMWKNRKPVLKVSSDSLHASRSLILKLLPLVENGIDGTLSLKRLPAPKDKMKSAAKILIYYYAKKRQLTELGRVKACYIALAKFQSRDLDEAQAQKMAEAEEAAFTKEIEEYISRTPLG